jgi:hypothetical protein
MKGLRFDTIEEILEESQRVLDTIPKRDFQGCSKHGRNAGTAVFVQKGSTLKVMEELNIQGNQTPFYKYCPGTFGYTLLCIDALVYNGIIEQICPIQCTPFFI